MEKEIFQQMSKISVDINQTSKGYLYIRSLKINADNIDELDSLIEQAWNRINTKISNLSKDSKQKEEIILDSKDTELFEKLRGLRLEIARNNNFPPYVIFHDSVLKQFARLKPQTKEEMLNIGNVGELKFEKYGERFLEIIKNFIRDNHQNF